MHFVVPYQWFQKLTTKFQFHSDFEISNLAMAKVKKVNIADTWWINVRTA
jgi:hypothetical protein